MQTDTGDVNREYLEATVMPVVEEGLKQLLLEKPDDPIEWLAAFLMRQVQKNIRTETTIQEQ